MRLTLLALPLLIPYLAIANDSATEERAPLVLGQGEQRILHEPGLERYSLGNDSIRAHVLDGNRSRDRESCLLIKGVSPGNSDLWVWKQDGSSEHRSIRVEKVSGGELSPLLEKALGHLEETEVILSGSGVILRGQVRTLRESARIHALIQGFPKEIHDETEVAETFLKESETRLDAWIKATPMASGLKLEREGQSLAVRGALARPSQLVLAEKEIRRIFPQCLIELDSLPDTSPTVYFRVFLLELKKSRFHTLGVSWPATVEGAFRVTTAGVEDMLSLDLALNTLEGEGSLKILSNPELVVRAPGEAELFAGGELPIQSVSRFYSNVTWKSYGLTLHLKVAQSSGERVRLEIFTEVSHLDSGISLNQIPGIQSNRMKTEVDARYGVPLFLSGLLQHGMREQARGLPLLRQIPVLGALFGSEDYLQDRSELVAVLLPASAPPSNPMQRLERTHPRGPAPPLASGSRPNRSARSNNPRSGHGTPCSDPTLARPSLGQNRYHRHLPQWRRPGLHRCGLWPGRAKPGG